MSLTTDSTTIFVDQEEELMATVHAIRQQEEIYTPDDYLQNMRNSNKKEGENNNPFDDFLPIDEDWRSKIVDWCYTVSDRCELDRNTIAISMNIFDRFMSIITIETCCDGGGSNQYCNRGVLYYQLAAMVCLYTAVKIHEPVALEPKVISLMSRNVYSAEEVVEMEQTILHTVQWRLNPPTPMSFVHYFLSMIPTDIVDPKEIDEYDVILELTKQQIELGIKDYCFVGSYASCMALAALTNAIQAIKSTTAISSSKFKLKEIISNIITNNNMCSESFILYQDYMWNSSLKELSIINHQQKMNYYQQQSIIKVENTTATVSANKLSLSRMHYGSSPRRISSPSFYK